MYVYRYECNFMKWRKSIADSGCDYRFWIWHQIRSLSVFSDYQKVGETIYRDDT